MQTTLPRILVDCIFGDLRDPLANHLVRPALVERQLASPASDFLIMPESFEKETALVPKGRAAVKNKFNRRAHIRKMNPGDHATDRDCYAHSDFRPGTAMN